MNSISNEQIVDKIKQIESEIADEMVTFEFSSAVGLLFESMYKNDEPKSSSESTGTDETNMSQVMQRMSELHTGENKTAESNASKQKDVQSLISLFTTSWKEVAEKNVILERGLRERIKKLEQSIEGEPSLEIQERIHSLKQQLDDCVAYYNWVESLVEFFDSGEILNIVPFKEPNLKNHSGGTQT